MLCDTFEKRQRFSGALLISGLQLYVLQKISNPNHQTMILTRNDDETISTLW
jgi:hypothetical protein